MRLLFVTVLCVVTAASAAALSASAKVESDVFVVGHGQLTGGASVGVVAFSGPLGVRGRLVVESSPGFRFVSRVTCVSVVGTSVLVGGKIVRATNPATIGSTSLVAIEDNGVNDRAGIAFSNSGLDTCPAFIPPMQELTSGNFVVK
jgi:hypothetical protein